MMTLASGVAGESSTQHLYNRGHPSFRHRLTSKLSQCHFNSSDYPVVNWDSSRVVTPGRLCGYHSSNGIQFFSYDLAGRSSRVQLFRSGENSQALFYQEDRVTAASVTSGIRWSQMPRPHISYDKEFIRQEGVDFQVHPTNYRGHVNYDGGHLIDRKYCTENSHYFEDNYVPQHFYYNQTLKECLVKHSDDFLEFPIYSPNPPVIKVKGREIYHQIPIGLIFVQIVKHSIQDIYYFPNQIDYKGLATSLPPSEKKAKTIASYFRLRREFHPLFLAAMIYDDKSKQLISEQSFFDSLDKLTFGMSFSEYHNTQSILTEFANSVVYKRSLDPRLCLNDLTHFSRFQSQPLASPFYALGEYLVHYGMRNALKSEVISVKSRIVFLNVVIDLIEDYHDANEHTLEFIDSFSNEFDSAFDELFRKRDHLELDELVYLAETYQRLSGDFCDEFGSIGYDICQLGDNQSYFSKTIKIFKRILDHRIELFIPDLAVNFLHSMKRAQESLVYFLKNGVPQEELRKEAAFLKSMRTPCIKLLDQQAGNSAVIQSHLQTSIHSSTQIRANVSYLRYILENLGISDDEDE